MILVEIADRVRSSDCHLNCCLVALSPMYPAFLDVVGRRLVKEYPSKTATEVFSELRGYGTSAAGEEATPLRAIHTLLVVKFRAVLDQWFSRRLDVNALEELLEYLGTNSQAGAEIS